MLNMLEKPNNWLVIGMGNLLPIGHRALDGAGSNYSIDIEHVLAEAVFHLNERERPMMLDHLVNDGYHHASESLGMMVDIVAGKLYRHLEAIVPTTYEVLCFDYLDDDLIVGVKPLE